MLLIRRFSLLSLMCLLSLVHSQAHNGRMDRPVQVDKEAEYVKRNRMAGIVQKYMNMEVKPCDDFFEFACGKWIENRSAEGDGDVITPQSELQTSIIKDMEAILSDNLPQLSVAELKVKHFYQACAQTRPTSPAQDMAMKTLKDQYGGRDNYDWLAVLAQVRKRFGFNILIGFDIDSDIENTHRNSVYLDEPHTTIIPPEYCTAEVIETMTIGDEYFQKLIEDISKNMQTWLSMREPDARRFGADIVGFEFKMCKKMRMLPSKQDEETDELNEIQQHSVRMTPQQLHSVGQIGQGRLNGKRDAGEIPRLYLEQLSNFEGVINFKRYVILITDFQQNRQIYLRGETYLKHLAKLIKTNSKITLGNYVLYRLLSEFNFPIGDDSSKQDHCIRLVQKLFPRIAGSFYTRRFKNGNYINELDMFYTNVVKVFEESLNADWMSEHAKRTARQKLAQIKARFPVYDNLDLNDLVFEQHDYWKKIQLATEYNAKKDLSRLSNANFDERPHGIEAFDVGARLMPMENEIIVGLALLQPPLFDSNYPYAMKYALLGQHLARELVLAFDEEGWRPTPLSQRQLDAPTEEGFRNRSDCYREQYSNYLHNDPEEFQNTTRLREIIADSSGLNLAFTTYLNWLQSIDPRNRALLSKETLPGINFTNTQLFFIHFAQTRCAAKAGEEPPPEFMPWEKHTPQRYDVNGPLSNFVEFAREFGCTPGDEMNAADKCVLY